MHFSVKNHIFSHNFDSKITFSANKHTINPKSRGKKRENYPKLDQWVDQWGRSSWISGDGPPDHLIKTHFRI